VTIVGASVETSKNGQPNANGPEDSMDTGGSGDSADGEAGRRGKTKAPGVSAAEAPMYGHTLFHGWSSVASVSCERVRGAGFKRGMSISNVRWPTSGV
jgi:hypothetical protein